VQARQGIDGLPHERLRLVAGDRFDVDAAADGEEQQGTLGGAIDGERQVELTLKVDRLFEQHANDPLAADRHGHDRGDVRA